MNKSLKILIFLLTIIPFSLVAQTINGRFIVLNHDTSNYTIKVQINGNSSSQFLGTSTIIFNFDSSAISFPTNPLEGKDYHFINFSGGNYSQATLTRPKANEIWFNIELANTNNGELISLAPQWMDVATLTFSVLRKSGSSNLIWQTANNNWGIYDANNSTMWNIGDWLNENTSPLPVELTKFNAVNSGNTVELKWQTATELNNYGFEVQRASTSSASTSSASTSSATTELGKNWFYFG